jgi:UDP-N-acetylmuramyl tripeptide synthase
MRCKCHKISPPPKEKGNFRVIYVIDVNASNALLAAKLTHQIMTDPDSILPVLEVMDCKGKVVTVDLSKKLKG